MHFSLPELSALRQAQGQQVEKVFYTYWKNLAHPDGRFEVLEWVELLLGSGQVLAITTDEEHKGLILAEFNFGEEKVRIQRQFQGQVSLERLEQDLNPTWRNLFRRKLSIGLLPPSQGNYPSQLLHLIFGNTLIEIGMDQEGLNVTRGKV